jgi:hypothetical protein
LLPQIDPDVLGGSYELGKQDIQCGNEFAGDLGAKGSVSRKCYHGGALGEVLLPEDDDDVEIFSPARFTDYANRKWRICG